MCTKDFHEDFRFQAKRLVSDSIWKEANIELQNGITWPETNEILEGKIPYAMEITKVLVVNNLKRAWQFLFENVEYEPKIAELSQYNRLIGEGGLIVNNGDLRKVSVNISGTSFIPQIPTKEIIEEELREIFSIENKTKRGIFAFARCSRGQWFNDGNKRVAALFSNHILIKECQGILSVPIEEKVKFTKNLINYYETQDFDKFYDYMLNKCFNKVIG